MKCRKFYIGDVLINIYFRRSGVKLASCFCGLFYGFYYPYRSRTTAPYGDSVSRYMYLLVVGGSGTQSSGYQIEELGQINPTSTWADVQTLWSTSRPHVCPGAFPHFTYLEIRQRLENSRPPQSLVYIAASFEKVGYTYIITLLAAN